MKMNTLIIIPARYASTRLPGKPLADIKGKPMIQHVYERAAQAFDAVFVATDDSRIQDAVRAFSGRSVMTSTKHQSGTDRCSEALEKAEKETGKTFDIIINLQGDEPLIDARQIQELEALFQNPDTKIATQVKIISDLQELTDPDQPKVVLDKDNNALYFSRQAIPYIRDKKNNELLKEHTFYKHIGLYGYRKETLKEIVKIKQSPLELAEKLEQNRWLENAYKIRCGITQYENFSIDTKNDLKKINMVI
jgi:3-deoxy-manno-octulosonate cytidylyltransferase (CMP-KDO synthetase)